MAKCTPNGVTIGLDLGDRSSDFCVLAADGQVLERGKVATTRPSLKKLFDRHGGSRMVMEVGTHSPWVSRLAESGQLEVIVANAHELALISRNKRKTDRDDAERLARLGRADLKLITPVRHRSAEYQADLGLLRARGAAVKARSALIAHVRGQMKAMGHRLAKCSAESFHGRAAAMIAPELALALEPIVRLIGALTEEIRTFDRQIERWADERYPQTRVLRQPAGVGALTALCYVLTIQDPGRIKDSRQVGAFLGLTPRQHRTGGDGPELRITKAGDHQLRRLLVISANYILGPFGPDCDLRRFGRAIAARGGKNARKRAKVAVARKLAVLLHRLWRTGEVYDPFYVAKLHGEAVPV